MLLLLFTSVVKTFPAYLARQGSNRLSIKSFGYQVLSQTSISQMLCEMCIKKKQDSSQLTGDDMKVDMWRHETQSHTRSKVKEVTLYQRSEDASVFLLCSYEFFMAAS